MKNTPAKERIEKVRDMLDENDIQFISVINTNKIKIDISDFDGKKQLTVTPEDVIDYYGTEARNISSGCRQLAGHYGDWRPIDELAQLCLDIYKILNKSALYKYCRYYNMTPRF